MMDNWLTSVSLSDQLEAAHTSMVGTIRSNRCDVPPAAKSSRGRQKKDSQYYIKDNKVMCSFWDKANKPVLLLSTKHLYGNHVQGEKPEIVQCYNATKSGVDNLDKLVRTYRSQRKCTRWPYNVFMAFVDVAIVAAMKTKESFSHYRFKMDLGYEMTLPLVRQRSNQTRLTRVIKMAMYQVGVHLVAPVAVDNQQQPSRRRCKTCQSRGHED